MDKTKKPFYGWSLVAMGALGNSLQGGFIFWSMGLYTSTFEDVFQATRARVTLIETAISVSVNLMFPLAGLWVDKGSARVFVTVGAASLGAGLCLLSVAGTLVQVWVAFATLIPLGILAMGVLPSSALISRWFRAKRGLGLGISVAGSSIGGFLFPPLVAFLFVAYGWRTALLIVGLGIMALAPVFYAVVRNYPEDKGQKQLVSERESQPDATDSSRPGWTFWELLRSPQTYAQVVMSGSLLAITLGLLANLSLHAKDLGFTTQQIGLLYSIIAFCSFGGKVAIGYLIDRVGIRSAAALTIALMATAMLVFLSQRNFNGVLVAATVVGLAMGGVTPVWTSIIANGFGANSFGRAIGLQNPMHIPLTAPSAPIAGAISDVTGSYQLVFVMYLGFVALAAVALLFIREPTRPTKRSPPALLRFLDKL